MRRSAEPRVPSQGELVFDAGTRGAPPPRAAIVNLSRGGVCARGLLPAGPSERVEEGSVVRVALGFADGTPPVAADARVAWVVPPRRSSDDACTFGLCFVELAQEDRARLSAAVAAREDGPRDRAPTATKEARLRIDDGPTLRARTDSSDETGAVIGAELPWLRLGARATGEIDGAAFEGRIAWVGLDVSAAGTARLQVRLAFDGGTRPGKSGRRDITLPYFTTEDALAEHRDGEPNDGEPSDDTEAPSTAVAWFEDRSRPTTTTASTAVVVRERGDAEGRAHALVQLGAQRRRRLAMIRAGVVVVALALLALLARAFLRAAPPAADPPPTGIAVEASPLAVEVAPPPTQAPPATRPPTKKGVAPRVKKQPKRAR